VIVFTIGHSTRSFEELAELLREHGIEHLVDVRRHPMSRRHPHFTKDVLARSLSEQGFVYRHAPELGGRRKALEGSPNSGWRDDGFRGYADYQQTAPFAGALEELVAEASSSPTAIMCAEAVPWRCHRQIIADVLVARGVTVRHVLGPRQLREHTLNPRARPQADGTLVYPESDQLELL